MLRDDQRQFAQSSYRRSITASAKEKQFSSLLRGEGVHERPEIPGARWSALCRVSFFLT